MLHFETLFQLGLFIFEGEIISLVDVNLRYNGEDSLTVVDECLKIGFKFHLSPLGKLSTDESEFSLFKSSSLIISMTSCTKKFFFFYRFCSGSYLRKDILFFCNGILCPSLFLNLEGEISS